MDLKIAGKRALLLASTGGLGYAAARALAREGVKVCVSGSNPGRAQSAAARLGDQTGSQVMGLVGDMSHPDNMAVLLREAEEVLGGQVDILFVNHGGPPLRTALEVSADELKTYANIMIHSPVKIIQEVVAGMVANNWGRVIMVGAAAVREPIPNNVLSNTYRAGLAHYCKTLAGEVVRDGITVNVVSPVGVLTDRTRRTAAALGEIRGLTEEEELARRERDSVAGRFGAAEDFGALVAFIASGQAEYMTGANWRVDGGSAMGLG
jgi:3-oxoacyl-[acyl-carrier protein] reductase